MRTYKNKLYALNGRLGFSCPLDFFINSSQVELSECKVADDCTWTAKAFELGADSGERWC